MIKLFSYGTLKDEGIQKALFNRTIKMERAFLHNNRLYEDTDGYYFVKPEGQDLIEGFVLELNNEQMWLIDQWEELPLYIREKINPSIRNEVDPSFITDVHGSTIEDVWIYRRPYSKGTAVIENKLSSLNYEDVLREAEKFRADLQYNKVKFADVYLSFPCCARQYKQPEGLLCSTSDIFLKNYKEVTQTEFSPCFLKTLERNLIGKVDLIIEIPEKEADVMKFEQRCNVFLTLHKDSDLAVVTIAIPVIRIPTHYLIDDLATSNIKIRVSSDPVINFNDWMKDRGLIPNGKPRAAIFSQKNFDSESLVKLLINEAVTMGKVKEKTFLEMANKDLAQYETAHIYASEGCLVEISSQFKDHYIDRFDSHILTLFVIELLLLQDAAISRLDAKVDLEIKQQRINPTRSHSIDVIEDLIEESTGSIKFWNVRNFKYPAAEQLAHNICNAFKIEKINNIHEKNKEKLEQLINIHSVKITEQENKNTNRLLLLLALIQVIPTFYLVSLAFLNKNLANENIISAFVSMTTVFIILIIFRRRLPKKRKKIF